MPSSPTYRRLAAALAGLVLAVPAALADAPAASGYDAFARFFEEWRSFEHPPMKVGAPDYTAATTARRQQELASWRERLESFGAGGDWPVAAQVDRALVRAEMDGFDFYARVLQPWARDPAFYLSVWPEQSDTPAHEGTVHHDVIELWTYSYPLSSQGEAKLARELAIVPPLLAQAR